MDISGDYAVIGARYNDDDGDTNLEGASYVFKRNGLDNWGQVAKLTASDGVNDDCFGECVSIYGPVVVVGAPYHNNSEGAAYVFDGSGGWSASMTEDAKLTATSGEANDNLGCSAAVYQNTVLVGAYIDDGSGTAYIFEEPQSGWSSTVNETAKLTPSDGLNGDYFANHNSIDMYGGTVLIGAYGDDVDYQADDKTGCAYVFEEPAGGWSGTLQETARLDASDGADDDYFGWAAGISDDYMVIGSMGDDDNGDGSGSAYLFE